jgi:hypothetical protein
VAVYLGAAVAAAAEAAALVETAAACVSDDVRAVGGPCSRRGTASRRIPAGELG